MEVKPILGEGVKAVGNKKYIEFKWYVWKSHRKAIVKYAL